MDVFSLGFQATNGGRDNENESEFTVMQQIDLRVPVRDGQG
jgi:hypothetical protein